MNKYHKGFITTWNGYKMIQAKDHPNKDSKGYVREHILVMEKFLGRYLNDDEIVHHLDENKMNNAIENLQLMTKQEHKKMHSSKPRKANINFDLALELLNKGYTKPQVAKYFNTCVSNLDKRMEKQGIEITLKKGGARRKIFEDII